MTPDKITDERLEELIHHCTVLPKGVVRNHVQDELHNALTELLRSRQLIGRLVETGTEMRDEANLQDAFCEMEGHGILGKWDALMKELEEMK